MQQTFVLIVVTMLVGCGTQRKAPQARPEPTTTPMVRGDDLLKSLVTTRDKLAADVSKIEWRLMEVQRHLGDLDDAHDLAKQRTSQISQALTDAELATIAARAEHGENHPAVATAQRREAEIRKLYEAALKQLMALQESTNDRDRIRQELAYKQDLLKKLEERIRSLELDT